MTKQLTAEQKIRQIITGSPVGEPHFKHQGEDVVHWLTGGTMPDAWVTYHPEGEQIVARCAGCQTVLGAFPANYEQGETSKQMEAIRLAGHEMHKPEGWPRMNISS